MTAVWNDKPNVAFKEDTADNLFRVVLKHLNDLPFAAATFVVGGAASMGLPGFSGFIAELQVVVGAWQAFPVFAVLTAAGILAGIAYTLRVLLKAFFAEGEARELPSLPAITLPERAGALLLLAATLLVGLCPRLLLQFITPSLNSPLMQPLWKAGMK